MPLPWNRVEYGHYRDLDISQVKCYLSPGQAVKKDS